MGAKHDDIVVLTADVMGSNKLGDFREAFLARFYNVGIAEADPASEDHRHDDGLSGGVAAPIRAWRTSAPSGQVLEPAIIFGTSESSCPTTRDPATHRSRTALGLVDASHFSRLFRGTFGETLRPLRALAGFRRGR
jgi:hypothetical protein